ncbi:hypothetical protein OIV83_003194 [Microbotryomycetes sp. JL201]|nr:hypothetical protein OIV83_003194 [Microbotryomycetes sp. JL201]
MAGHAGPRTAGAFHPHLPGMGHRLGAKLLGTCTFGAGAHLFADMVGIRSPSPMHALSHLVREQYGDSRLPRQGDPGCASMWFFIFYRARQDGAVLLGLKHPWDH